MMDEEVNRHVQVWTEWLRSMGYDSNRALELDADLTPGYLNRYLNGEYKVDNIRLWTLKRIAEKLTERSGKPVGPFDVYRVLQESVGESHRGDAA